MDWKKVFRDGFCPGLSDAALEALARGLAEDDSRLVQGATTSPPPLQAVVDWPVEAACLIAYAGWQGDGHEHVGDCEEYFARTCFDCDQRLGEPAACRFLLNTWDETPRDEARRMLLDEVRDEQRRRAELEAGQCPGE